MFDGFVYFDGYTFVHNFGNFLCCRGFQILHLTTDSLNLEMGCIHVLMVMCLADNRAGFPYC